MKIKTSELNDQALDWAVATCQNVECDRQNRPIWFDDEDQRADYAPSTNWSQGGPIIEREHIDIRHTFTKGGYRTAQSVDAVHATINLPNGNVVFKAERAIWEYGPTPLIAAMRCYVASKLGDEVDVPEELCGRGK